MSFTPVAKTPLKFQPKNPGRRSKEERDAIERAEAERRKVRTAAAEADAASEAASRKAQYGITDETRNRRWPNGKDPRISYRTGGGGRGGYMGQRALVGEPVPRPPENATVPKTTRSTAPSKPRERRTEPSSMGAASTKSRTRRPIIKEDDDGDIAMLGIIPTLKKEYEDDHGNYDDDLSSDPDELALGPRKNIEYINLASDEELDDEGEGAGEAFKAMPFRRPIKALAPIRVNRKSHVERVVGVSTEASSIDSAESRVKTEDKEADEGTGSLSRRGKPRAKAVEYLGANRVWRGVGNDEEPDQVLGVTIKKEPQEETSMGATIAIDKSPQALLQIKTTSDEGDDVVMEDGGVVSEDESKPQVAAKIKHREKYHQNREPLFQTNEERREWIIAQDDLRILREEFGRVLNMPSSARDDGDVNTPLEEDDDQGRRRENAVYLFQFPPIMPSLFATTVKKEPQSPKQTRAPIDAENGQTTTQRVETIKLEDDEPGVSGSYPKNPKVTLAAGKAGKLRIHESGRATISWGETSFEMKMGQDASFLQTTIFTKIHSRINDAAPTQDCAGDALSFGQVKGKLIVTPDWNEILG